jgi:hypothetical protein
MILSVLYGYDTDDSFSGERTEFGVLEKRMQRIMSEGKRKEHRNEKST